MVNITLFEIHLDDASFEANAPFSDAEAEDAPEAAAEDGVDVGGGDEGGASNLVPLVVGLVLLIGLAVLVRKLRGGGDDDADEADTIDPIDVETS